MNKWFLKIIDLASQTADLDKLKRELAKIATRAGFDNFLYLNLRPSGMEMVTNLPAEWQCRYLEGNWSQRDPIVAAARRGMRAFTWEIEQFRSPRRNDTHELLLAARDNGLCLGLSIPIKIGFGHLAIFSMTAREPGRQTGRHVDEVIAAMAVAQLHCCLQPHIRAVPDPHRSALSPKQALCLRWAAEGKSMQDIATMEEITSSTVAFHLNNARKVLEAVTLPQATAIATRLQLI